MVIEIVTVKSADQLFNQAVELQDRWDMELSRMDELIASIYRNCQKIDEYVKQNNREVRHCP